MKKHSLVRASVRKIAPYVPGEQPSDPSIIKLNTNENPYPPSPAVEDVCRSLDMDALRRYPPADNLALRQQIARLHKTDVEHTFAANGSDEVLALCTRAFVENDGAIGYFEPSYSLYPVLSDIRDVRKVSIALEDDFSWRQPPHDAAQLFFLTNPNAPTGAVFPKGILADFCRAFEGVVLIDEAYVDFADMDCMDLALELDNVLVSRTLSKSYSLAGLRVGYCVGSPLLIEALAKIKDSYNLDAVAQSLALAALKDQATKLRNRDRIIEERERLSLALKQRRFKVTPSQTNFIWTRPPDEISAIMLFEALKTRNILVRHFSGKGLGNHLRITIGTREQMTFLIEAIESILGDL